MRSITPQQECMILLLCSFLPESPLLMTSAGCVCQKLPHPSDQIQLSISQDLEHFTTVVGISKMIRGCDLISINIASHFHNLVGLVRAPVLQVTKTQLRLAKAKNNDEMANFAIVIWKSRS